MIRLLPLILILTIPLPIGNPLAGVPVWAWTSLLGTVIFALVLIYAIETRWEDFAEPDHE